MGRGGHPSAYMSCSVFLRARDFGDHVSCSVLCDVFAVLLEQTPVYRSFLVDGPGAMPIEAAYNHWWSLWPHGLGFAVFYRLALLALCRCCQLFMLSGQRCRGAGVVGHVSRRQWLWVWVRVWEVSEVWVWVSGSGWVRVVGSGFSGRGMGGVGVGGYVW